MKKKALQIKLCRLVHNLNKTTFGEEISNFKKHLKPCNMRKTHLILLSFVLLACNNEMSSTKMLQSRIDSLEVKLANTYKPGFGDFMSSIQTHHSKLWFAGQSENWDLADFEVHELEEAIEGIQKHQAEREESQMLGILNAPLDSIEKSIEQRDPEAFKRNFIHLTNTCNKCHQAVNFGFNVVKIPTTSPFTNQEFHPIE